eukprot:jgi/Galph1/2868/GphlegSOOS_G1540.1
MSQGPLTPFERHLKKVEEKRKRDEKEAGEIYQEFVKTFASEEEKGIANPSFAKLPSNKGDKTLFPLDDEETSGETPGLLDNMYRQFSCMKSAKKKRNIDLFLEEIKSGQTAGSQVAVDSGPQTFVHAAGSHDSGDPLTTNIFLGNLNPATTEESLLVTFGRYGPIGSIKIMWPRTPEEHLRGYNSGFVSFMERDDAEAALEALQGSFLDGSVIRLAWGKPVKRPLHPLPPPKGFTYGGSSLRTTALDQAGERAKENQFMIDVLAPFDLQRRREIDLLAFYVAKEGYPFECLVAEREKNLDTQGRSRFRFLFDVRERDSAENIYYRWKVYSLCQGDMESRWRTVPFVMYQDGASWRPPTCSKPVNNPGSKKNVLEVLNKVADDEEKTEEDAFTKVSKKDASLKQGDVEELMEILRNISLERQVIADAMVFCVERAFAAGDIVAIIAESLTLDETPLPVKVARLYLVSDILHNSVAPVHNASAFRARFQIVLPVIFESIGKRYEKVHGFMASSSVRSQIEAVLEAWTMWSLYPEDFIQQLRQCYRRSDSRNNKLPFSETSSNQDESSNSDNCGGMSQQEKGISKQERNVGEELQQTTEDKEKDIDMISPDELQIGNREDNSVSVIDNEDIDGEPLDE